MHPAAAVRELMRQDQAVEIRKLRPHVARHAHNAGRRIEIGAAENAEVGGIAGRQRRLHRDWPLFHLVAEKGRVTAAADRLKLA